MITRKKDFWQEQKELGDKYHAEIKKELATTFCQVLIKEADFEEDRKFCVDYTTTNILRFAARIRKYQDLKFCDELTLRSDVVSSNMTEYEKFIYDISKADYYFLGFENETENGLVYWNILSCFKIKRYLLNLRWASPNLPNEVLNKNKKSSFMHFKLKDIEDVVVKNYDGR